MSIISRWLRAITLGLGAVVLAICYMSLARPKVPKPGSAPFISNVRDWRQYAQGFHRLGSSNSPLTVVVFSDYECGYCAAINPTLEKLQEEYKSTLTLVYRHFPLGENMYSRSGAIAATCAESQGRFWEFSSLLFEERGLLEEENWNQLALKSGISNTTLFQSCMNDSTYAHKVDADIDAGFELGVIGTPTLLLNDRRIDGFANYDVLDSLAKSELARYRAANTVSPNREANTI